MELKKGRNKITIKEYQEIRYIFDIGEENVNHKETLNILDKMLNGEKIEEKLVVSKFRDKYCVFRGNKTFIAINDLLDYGLKRIPFFDKDKIFGYEITIMVEYN